MGKRGPKKGAPNAGRPCKDLDEKLFIRYCQIHCTQEEISYLFDCDINTVNAWCKRRYNQTFSEAYKKHSAFGKETLRRAQFAMAIGSRAYTEEMPDGTKRHYKGSNPNPMMQVWLGKQYLGQTDQPVDESMPNKYETPESMKLDDKEAS